MKYLSFNITNSSIQVNLLHELNLLMMPHKEYFEFEKKLMLQLRVVESLINNNQPVNISELSLTWYLRQLSSDLMTLEPEQ